ncbi:penicillin-binding transpeptidase domain-containing protein [Thermosipho atlanticus]|uniref:Penicillin-binding protein 2 n=1 Tax=Thermosipho atlanticus DSM 15807 TaxID=1123380 RepID=A0A1M5QT45_9BACT|nr:penicillin-binding transpeptidase domain-containing protein [Thermosipho atlanticus]SHH17297.1 penicillin-binding protein 2 [Thermosipho atlanticus DSM 15807]
MRYKITVTIFALMFAILFLFLFKMQVLEYSNYRAFIDSLMQKTRLVQGTRGTIYDRNGLKLAWSIKVPYITYNRNFDISELERYLDSNQLNTLISSGKVEISKVQLREIEKLGYDIQFKEIRNYVPYVFHIVGYVNSNNVGSYGIEKTYDQLLRGKLGSELILISPSGKIRQKILKVPPENGNDINLTIDYPLQKYISEEIKKIDNPGAVIVEDVKTGEILALVSYPDIEKPINLIDTYEWRKIINNPENPLLNRATMGLYSPGSAIKPLIAISGLLNNESTTTTINCNGQFTYTSSSGKILATYNDWLLSGHGKTDLIKALRVSCNVYFYNLALKLGIDKIKSVATLFKIDKKTGIDIPETEGLFPDKHWKETKFNEPWYPGDTIITGIGQGYILLTPLELLNFYVTIANDGKVPVPHLLKKDKIEIFNNVKFKKEIWDTVKQGLIEVTTVGGNIQNRGTAYQVFKDFKVTVAGKTGTAEVGKGKLPHSWFVGFAPAHNPKYAVIVMFENAGSGSEKAAPFARKIFEFLFQRREKNE